MLNATWAKGRQGDWLARVVGAAQPGDQAVVRSRDGREKTVRLGRIVWSGEGVTLATIAREGEDGGQPAAQPAARRAVRNGAGWRPCGYPGCSPHYCDECDGEGYRPGR
jgi:hypothetical protein